MEIKRYEILVLGMIVTFLSCVTLWGGKADGQEKRYPNKPIEVIVNFSPGGTNDIGTRILANDLSKELGVPISIQYKAGAGGVIGASYVSTSKPDGYTFVSTASGPIIAAPFLEKEPPYNSLKDFTPIASYVVNPNTLSSNSSSKLTSFDTVIKLAKEKPGALTCVTSGVGTTSHFMIEVLKTYGVDITHVPAKGGGASLPNILGGHVDLAILLYAQILPQVKSGALKILATTNKIIQEPGIPTFTEKGYPEIESLGVWQGFLGPPNLPKPIVDQLANSIRKVVQIPSVIKALEEAGFYVEFKGPEEYKKKIAEDCMVIEKIVKAAGLGKYSK